MRQKRSAGRKRGVAAISVGVAAMFSAVLMFGFNPFQDNLGTINSPVPVIAQWDNLPVAWLLNAATPNGNVSNSGCNDTLGNCIQLSLSAGFTAWVNAQIAGQSLTSLSVTGPASSTLTDPVFDDCQNVVGFSDTTSGDFPTGTIAFTQVATVTRPSGSTGPFQYNCSGRNPQTTQTCSFDDCMADADIEFNPTINFTSSTTPPSNTFNLQSVATHEEGHLLGLDHSGIGHTVMFPFGDSALAGQQTQLATDDAIGISFLYPCTTISGNCTGIFSDNTAIISGAVNLSGTAIFGAHVIAVNVNTGNAVSDTLTAPDGSYNLVGLPPGNYSILALPFSPDVDSGLLTIDNFSGWLCGYADSMCTTVPVNPTSYTGRYY